MYDCFITCIITSSIINTIILPAHNRSRSPGPRLEAGASASGGAASDGGGV